MALSNHSSFYYGLRITAQNQSLDFKEGSTEYSIQLAIGSYTGSKLAIEIEKKLNSVGSLEYSVLFDRVTGKFTISANSVFSLLCATGSTLGTTSFQTIGFNISSDKTGLSSYVSDNMAVKKYTTQFWLQSYKPTDSNKKAIDPQLNESSSGVVEVVKQGTKRFMSCEFYFITSIIQGKDSKIRSNENGRQDYIDFIEWCTEKYLIEFMENENSPENYQTFILESTEQDQKGLDYELIELYDRQLPEYFRSGVLKFRLME
jgi:hypothetical protein